MYRVTTKMTFKNDSELFKRNDLMVILNFYRVSQ